MPKVFISYRREDSAYPAQSVYQTLADKFGRDSVVFDVDTIPRGVDFVRIEIRAALQRRIPVIPVLVGRASMPNANDLPSPLKRLSRYNAAEVRAAEESSRPDHHDLDRHAVQVDLARHVLDGGRADRPAPGHAHRTVPARYSPRDAGGIRNRDAG